MRMKETNKDLPCMTMKAKVKLISKDKKRVITQSKTPQFQFIRLTLIKYLLMKNLMSLKEELGGLLTKEL